MICDVNFAIMVMNIGDMNIGDTNIADIVM